MKVRNVLAGLAVLLGFSASVAYSAPAESVTYDYFDEQGDLVGSSVLTCSGRYAMYGIKTDIFIRQTVPCR
jgi:hypothetical protein